MPVNLQNSKIQQLTSFSAKDMPVDILRLDLVHPIVSGNKWFKLQYYLKDALASGKDTIATFGGAYSNHIVATAYAASETGLKSTGFIRGERTETLSPTLQDARKYGMNLVFTGREMYRDKEAIIRSENKHNLYWIMEGGYGELGAKGASGILNLVDKTHYSHILCAAGTGTMMAGLIMAALPGQEVIGISVLKNNYSLEKEIKALLGDGSEEKSFTIFHDYHFGGYAKHPPELIAFIKETWFAENLPTDIVYTSKLLFAVKDLFTRNYFLPRARILLVHSGGLQGNASLPPNTIPFS